MALASAFVQEFCLLETSTLGSLAPQVTAVSHTQQHPHTRWPLWV